MELLVILGLAVLVGAVILYRKRSGKRPGAPEVPGNDGK
ncbi:LPXTG cell wall anchor domain-containing protein [Nocardia sp. NPDC003726]